MYRFCESEHGFFSTTMGKMEVNMKKNTNMLLAAFMLFIFPIISVLLGVFLGGYIGSSIGIANKISQVIGGILAFIIAVLVIKIFDKHAKVDENAEKIHWDDL